MKDSYPLPRIDDTLDALVGARWFSTLDLKSGYHQVEVAEEDKPKTAFSFGQGLWHFNVMPFGICNAPGCFERLMERVLDGLQWKTALVYIDDIIVFGSTFEDELERLRKANLKLSPKKCSLFQHEVPFFGHVISQDGVRTDPQKVAVVKKWPVPTSVAEVRSYLGLCTYYRRFVQDFASVAAYQEGSALRVGRGVPGRVRPPEEGPGGGTGAALPGPEAPLPVGYRRQCRGRRCGPVTGEGRA